MRNKVIFKINYLYSIVWIRLNKSNKWNYREQSKVHEFLMNLFEV